MALRDERGGHRAVPIEALRLEIRPVGAVDFRSLVPVEPEPAKAVEDPFDHVLRRSLDVGVFDAQHEDAAEPAREEPVEERGARAADVEIPGRRWGEADARSHREEKTSLPILPGCQGSPHRATITTVRQRCIADMKRQSLPS